MKTAEEWAEALRRRGYKALVDVKGPEGIVEFWAHRNPSRLHLEVRYGKAALIEADEDGQCGELTDETESLDVILEALKQAWPAGEPK